ncbi:MAG: UDP-N-acetylmuramate dehydrogenase, partial [Spirochaetota bacterium]|nr:UDP-N-acetylmuramate dehydrogenase [Spirochaetota bacterium]
ISTLRLDKLKLNPESITVQSGVVNSTLSEFACDNSITGFEFLYGMPGTVGGSTLMNARAFGRSMSDIILSVTAIDTDFQPKTFLNSDIGFDYKKSLFQTGDHLIYEVTFSAQRGQQDSINSTMLSNKEKRLSTGQYLFPSAGCVFKNDYNLGEPTGKIIDDLGLKGERVGDAEIYSKHANFIINHGNATSDDVLALINRIKLRAKQEKNIDLECEIRFLGPR